jgi:hypothetical protein
MKMEDIFKPGTASVGDGHCPPSGGRVHPPSR